MKKFVNVTPHTINEVNSGASFAPEGNVARVTSSYKAVEKINGVPLYKVAYGEVVDLPAPKPDTIYIVSGMVLEAADASRTDLVAPGQLVRNSEGQPIGCDGFRVK